MTEWHIITGEYPPQCGGVSDYTRLVASGLVAAGDFVHVWCPRFETQTIEDPGIIVHRELGNLSPQDLLRAGRLLDRFPSPRRLLVQWVPHAYGFRSANLPFSFWVWNRASAHKDEIDIMIHEPFLPLHQDKIRHTALAIAHRIMLAGLLRAAKRVWVAIPKWEEYCRPYAFGRLIRFSWLPVISNIAVEARSDLKDAIRQRYAPSDKMLIGHFGTCGGEIGAALRSVIPSVLNENPRSTFLVIGQDSDLLRNALGQADPTLLPRIHSTGNISPDEVSSHISACDMLLQPYPDGVSSRRSSLMAALSHGKPVITNSGPLTEPLWKDSRAVILVPAGDHQGMISAAQSLIADPHERTRLSVQGKTMYDSHFCLQHIVRQLRDCAS